jgi:hypothetical protein
MAANMGDDAAIEAIRSAVFGTAELFEQILLQVDMKTLLLSQRVNTQWRDTITDSPALQKKLFFKPGTFGEAKEFVQADEHHGRIFITLTPEYRVWKLTEPAQPTAIVNPLLLRCPWLCPAELGLKDAAPDEHASWMKMLYIQPPPLNVAPSFQFAVQHNSQNGLLTYVQFTHKNQSKLDTVGKLLKAVDHMLVEKGHRMDWDWVILKLHGMAYI